MINRLLEFSLRNRVLVVAIYLGLAGWGWWALRATPIDAIPDLSDVQVIVMTEWPGQAPELVEDQVTYPLSTELLKVPGTRFVPYAEVTGAAQTRRAPKAWQFELRDGGMLQVRAGLDSDELTGGWAALQDAVAFLAAGR